MAQRIQVRRGTQTEWLTANPIPWPGEICLESDTRRWKFGDGVTHYADLEYSQNIPAHEWDGSKIRFQNPDGSWGDWVDLAVLEADYHDYIPQEEAPSHKEGRVFYDQETGTLTAYTTSTEVKQNLGRGLMERCYNDTGVRIANGTPAYVSGNYPFIGEFNWLAWKVKSGTPVVSISQSIRLNDGGVLNG